MKRIIATLFVFMILAASEAAIAQTGSDYYMPLRVGNYLKFHSDGKPSGWAPRITTYTLEGTDSISGNTYLRERGREIADDSSFNNTFLLRWLGKSSNGDVMIAAVGEESVDIDSATILPVPSPFFASAALVPGYSIRHPYSNYFMVDSTISNTETVTAPAGTFTNCIKQSETHYDSAGQAIFLEYHYFAKGVGMVLNVRTVPTNEAHTDVLIQYSAVTSIHGENAANTPNQFSLSQNYPNPFNPSTVIGYQLSAVSRVTLKVYDVLGREVRALVNEQQAPGYHSVTFNAANLPSGVYFYRIQVGPFTEIKKLVLLK